MDNYLLQNELFELMNKQHQKFVDKQADRPSSVARVPENFKNRPPRPKKLNYKTREEKVINFVMKSNRSTRDQLFKIYQLDSLRNRTNTKSKPDLVKKKRCLSAVPYDRNRKVKPLPISPKEQKL